MQHYGASQEQETHLHTGLGVIEHAFPGQVFPHGVIHEFISNAQPDAAATNGFLSGLLQSFMRKEGYCLWISTRRSLFPPALKAFGLEPHRIIFVDVRREREALWAIEEALKCDILAAVVGELSEMNFTASRRLQLAVEESRVTGFIHRYRPRIENTIASVSRWKITPLASHLEGNLPGVGHPRWQVRLLKVRNGRPGSWRIEWVNGGFQHVPLFSRSISQRLIHRVG